jgi:tetratricopeptide (TPR) repeat protein
MREMEAALRRYSPALHRQFGIQDPGMMCMAYSAWGLWELGRPDEALARIHDAVRMAGEFEDRFSQAVVTAYAVSVELLRGDDEAAWQRAEACVQLCESFGFPVWLAITRCMRGSLLCRRGAFDEGLQEMEAGHALWLRTGARVSQPLYLSLQVEGLLLAGRLQEAADRVDQGLALVERLGERQLQAEMWRLRGEIALRSGDARNGEAWLRLAYALALRRHRLGFALRAATALAAHWAASGNAARARRLLQPLLARWTQGRDTRDLRQAAALLAQLPTEEHRQGEAA